MKVETIIPEHDRKRIEEYQSKIQEIKDSHIADTELLCFYSLRGMIKFRHKMKEDPLIKIYEKMIEYIHERTVPQMILIAENDEDKKKLYTMVQRGGYNK